jgi:hypothetical protein
MIAALVALLVTATPDPKQLPAAVLKMAIPHSGTYSDAASAGTKGFGGRHHGNGGTPGVPVPGIDSIKNWTGSFTEPGFDGNGIPQSVWPFAMAGRAPQQGGTNVFHAPVIPVIVDLLDANGNVAISQSGIPLTFDPRPQIKLVLQSPIFETWPYIVGRTQWTDAIFREEFLNRVPNNDRRGEEDCDHGDGWHNLLDPDVKGTQRMQIPDGHWFYVLNPDGSLAAAIVDGASFSNALFPQTVPVDNTTVIGAAELAGDMKTRDVTTLLFNNVYLFDGNINNCCVLGFHTFDFEPGDASNGNLPRLFVFNYSSYIGPGLFTGGFEDITALSHELSELFNDPFVDNATPWYLSPSGLCQNNLETGDAIEGLNSNVTFSIQKHGRTYHPQNVPLFQWFAFEPSPSSSFNGAYSFPDETTLTTLSPPNLLPGCVPAP